jgi:hypothetical protein
VLLLPPPPPSSAVFRSFFHCLLLLLLLLLPAQYAADYENDSVWPERLPLSVCRASRRGWRRRRRAGINLRVEQHRLVFKKGLKRRTLLFKFIRT